MIDDSLDVGIGVIRAYFQSEGSSPALIEILNSFVTAVVITTLDCFFFADKPSGPLALETSNLDRYSYTSSSLQRILDGHSVVGSG